MLPRDRVRSTCGSPLLARHLFDVAGHIAQILDACANHVTTLLSLKSVGVVRSRGDVARQTKQHLRDKHVRAPGKRAVHFPIKAEQGSTEAKGLSQIWELIINQ